MKDLDWRLVNFSFGFCSDESMLVLLVLHCPKKMCKADAWTKETSGFLKSFSYVKMIHWTNVRHYKLSKWLFVNVQCWYMEVPSSYHADSKEQELFTFYKFVADIWQSPKKTDFGIIYCNKLHCKVMRNTSQLSFKNICSRLRIHALAEKVDTQKSRCVA